MHNFYNWAIYSRNSTVNNFYSLKCYPIFSELFVKEDGSLVTQGDILERPKMAVTLETIADDPEAFYDPDSQLAKDIVADIAEYGEL